VKQLKNILFIFLLFLLILPALQGKFHFVKTAGLNGYFVPQKKPLFRKSNWYSGTYQDSLSTYYKENTGFRSDYVRLYNQVDFSLFSIPHAGKIILGKKGYLFGDEYITSWLGTNFPGKKYCDEKVALLKKLQDKLWNEKKILLVVLLVPDKGTFYPEYIPDRFLKRKKEPTNYSYYAAKCAETGINMIDFNRWLLLAKDTSRYPLYPKTGIHWTSYSAVLAADSLLKYLHVKMSIPVPRMIIDDIETSPDARDVDDDIAQTMNLIWRIPHPVYAYPKYHFTFDTLQKKPAALFIGDSFYWNWYNPGIIHNIFSNEEFWYYNQDIYPESKTKLKSVSEINIEDAINRQNVIILMQVNGGYGNLGYGFTDMAISALDPANSNLRRMELTIRNNPDWMKTIREKAEKDHRRVDEQVRMDALYMLDQERIKKQH
jgi:hypothetical protein